MDNEETTKDPESSSDKKKEANKKLVAPISGKDIIPKKYINTQKVTNAQNLIIQSEPPAKKVIIMDNKMRTDVSLLYIETGVTCLEFAS